MAGQHKPRTTKNGIAVSHKPGSLSRRAILIGTLVVLVGLLFTALDTIKVCIAAFFAYSLLVHMPLTRALTFPLSLPSCFVCDIQERWYIFDPVKLHALTKDALATHASSGNASTAALMDDIFARLRADPKIGPTLNTHSIAEADEWMFNNAGGEGTPCDALPDCLAHYHFLPPPSFTRRYGLDVHHPRVHHRGGCLT